MHGGASGVCTFFVRGWGKMYERYTTHETPECRVRTVQRAASVHMSTYSPRAQATAVASITSNAQQHQQCCRRTSTSNDKRLWHPACSKPPEAVQAPAEQAHARLRSRCVPWGRGIKPARAQLPWLLMVHHAQLRCKVSIPRGRAVHPAPTQHI